MNIARISATLIVIVFFACKSTDKKSEPVIVEIAAAASNTTGEKYRLDTTVPAGFNDDTSAQINSSLKLIEEFNKAAAGFERDTFSIDENTTEGGEIIVVYSAQTHYIQFYGTIFGEMGKKEFSFLVYRGSPEMLSSVIYTDFTYDKPMYIDGSKTIATQTSYEIFCDDKLVAVLDGARKKQNLSTVELKTKEKDTNQFYKDYISQVKLLK